MKQKNIFIESEGDQWYLRNRHVIQKDDPILCCLDTSTNDEKLLEIGCSDGKRLKKLQDEKGFTVFGIDPSLAAVTEAKKCGLDVIQGSADILSFENNSFDVIIYGFCLYLCDRADLFKIAAEGDRVLKDNGVIVIYDFDPGIACVNKYHHLEGINSYKMDYSKLYLWNPSYTMERKQYFSHNLDFGLNEDRNERISVTVIQKQVKDSYIKCEFLSE